MNVARSEVLQSNASYLESIAYTHTIADVTWANFTQEDAYSITFTSNKHVTWNPHTSDDYFIPIYVTFSGSVSPSTPLEWAIVYYSGNTTTVRFESDWVSSMKPIYITSDQKSYNSYFKIKFYVRKADGSALDREELNKCGFSVVGNVYYNVDYAAEITQTTAIPPSWLETTTESVPVYSTQTTMITTVDYEGFLTTLTVPVDIRPAIAQFDQIINDLWSLHYIPFLVCFALIMGLAAWLLH